MTSNINHDDVKYSPLDCSVRHRQPSSCPRPCCPRPGATITIRVRVIRDIRDIRDIRVRVRVTVRVRVRIRL